MDKAAALIICGLVLAMAGVGGVENSITTSQLLVSVGVAVLGLLSMFGGTQLIKEANRDPY